MSRTIVAVLASLGAGLVLGAWYQSNGDGFVDKAETAGTGLPATVDGERLRKLEQAVSEEREARQQLEEQILALTEQLAGTQPSAVVEAREQRAVQSETASRDSRRDRSDWASRLRIMKERRLEQLMTNGYSEIEASQVLKAESDAQLQAMKNVWEAQRNGDSIDPFDNRNSAQALLREQLGDAEYERFLSAQQQPVAVQIVSIMEGGPGSLAGIKEGDEIVSYNGKRTFSMTDLRNETMQGAVGEDVVVEIDRDGLRMQLTIPRGPIGMNGRGAFIRGMNWWGG